MDDLYKSSFSAGFEKLNYDFGTEQSLSALDLGCGEASNLFYLYRYKDFKKLIGIDTENLPSYADFNNHMSTDKQYKLSEEKFDNLFDLRNEDAQKYLLDCEHLFNVIILSNILHLFKKEEGEEILINCTKRLKPNGLIYIRIANDNHKGWKDNSIDYSGPRWGLTEQELINFIKPLVPIHSPSMYENNIEVFAKMNLQ